MNEATFSKTLSGLRELDLDVANLGQGGQIQIEGQFPTTEKVLISDPTTNSTIYRTINPLTAFPVGSPSSAVEYQLAFSPGIWRVNNDNINANVAIDDGPVAATTHLFGRAVPMDSSIELIGHITIPYGWTATKALVSCVDNTGANLSLLTIYHNVLTWGTAGFTTAGTGITNSETTLTTPMEGAVNRVLLIKVSTSSTNDFVGGGYITLTQS